MPRASAKKPVATNEEAEPDSPTEFSDVLAALSRPLTEEQVRQRVGWTDRGGNQKMVDYIEWHTACDILDKYAVDWSHEVKSVTPIGQWLAIVVAITIGHVTREGLGLGRIDQEQGIKKAEHDALKRAAVKFGIARELYHKEESHDQQNYTPQQNYVPQGQGQGQNFPPQGQGQAPPIQQGYAAPTAFPPNPRATNLADMVTTKQLGMIRAVAREANIDADAACQQQLNCNPSELSRKGASAFIEWLRNGGSFNGQGQSQGQAPVNPPAQPQFTGTPPTLPPPIQQPASTQQGQFATTDQVNGLTNLCQMKGYGLPDIAKSYSAGRTDDISQLSQAEAASAITALNSV